MNHRIISRRGPQGPLRQASRMDGAISSLGKLDGKSDRRQAFLEDFNMEHCCSTVTVKLLAFSASADALEQASSRNPYSQPVNSPSCVYLG